MLSTKEIRKNLDAIEKRITEIALKGTDLVPPTDYAVELNTLASKLFDLSNGLNELRYNKLGQPMIMVNIFCDDKAKLDYLSGYGTYFSTNKGLHPAFIINDEPIKGFRLGKYPDVRVDNTNYHVSLFGLEPAHDTGGVTESYDGLASANDTINAGTTNTDGDSVHNITMAEYSYLGLRAVSDAFECRGDDYYGTSYMNSSDRGTPIGKNKNDSGYYYVSTGSGPDQWRHDGTPFGVWGMRGPVRMIVHGYQLNEGELEFIPNNNAAEMTATELAQTSSEYKGILEDGSFVDAGTALTMKYDYLSAPGTGIGLPFELTNTLANQQQNNDTYGSLSQLSSMTVHDGVTVPDYLRWNLMYPLISGTPNGYCSMRNAVGMSRVSARGSYFNGSSGGGWSSSFGNIYSFGNSYYSMAGRCASIM